VVRVSILVRTYERSKHLVILTACPGIRVPVRPRERRYKRLNKHEFIRWKQQKRDYPAHNEIHCDEYRLSTIKALAPISPKRPDFLRQTYNND